ncbi:MAG: 50S ribosomal protein L13 [Hydrotalea sp.]|nr:50S ribosomal protein L13 [Hydrotalea sp.]
MEKNKSSGTKKTTARGVNPGAPVSKNGPIIRAGGPSSFLLTPKSTKEQWNKKWYLIDADGLVLGRMASEIAKILRGKHKPTFTPSAQSGDNVIVINAEKIALTGRKRENSIFYWHTGYPGGVKTMTPEKQLTGKFPERLIERAVERMIRRTPMGKKQLKNLKVYAGKDHPHQGMNPIVLDLAKQNRKNSRKAA